ncbi:hypothetical protein C7M84_024000 [Penaeus vannamei]|uniref:Uncharacterized protein n=1 Tax=Penaeus vannamei TaxID=6689 RepID=A0A3R7SZC7_PENVA|nr:uncharacterized protein LOC113800365 [Penaeus vannamei]ROT82831.1 hypothetical protein C7M84_024000 [Penaeus vannamei]
MEFRVHHEALSFTRNGNGQTCKVLDPRLHFLHDLWPAQKPSRDRRPPAPLPATEGTSWASTAPSGFVLLGHLHESHDPHGRLRKAGSRMQPAEEREPKGRPDEGLTLPCDPPGGQHCVA